MSSRLHRHQLRDLVGLEVGELGSSPTIKEGSFFGYLIGTPEPSLTVGLLHPIQESAMEGSGATTN